MISIRATTDLDLVMKIRKLAVPGGDNAGPCDGILWWIAYNGQYLAKRHCRSRDGAAIACAGLKILPAEKVGFLYYACVLPKYRGQGIQKRLIRVRVRKTAIFGLAGCITYTLPHNCKSANSLIAEGFRMYYPENPWQGKDVWYFRKLFGK